jgi:hypothetical protein
MSPAEIEIETTELLLANLAYCGFLTVAGCSEDGELHFRATDLGRVALEQLKTRSMQVCRD